VGQKKKEIMESKFYFFGPLLYHAKLDEKILDQIRNLCSKDKQKDNRAYLAGHLDHEYKIDPIKLEHILSPVFENFYGVHKTFYNRYAEGQYVVGAWVNYMKKGDFNPLHEHSNCDWSGVIYLQIPDELRQEQNSWIGTDTGPGGILFRQKIDTIPSFINSVSFYPVVGDTFIFPSQLKHSVYPFKSDGERITVAFNTKDRLKTKG